MNRSRRRNVASLSVAGAAVLVLALVTPAHAAGSSPEPTASTLTAGDGCPANSATIVPNAEALASAGARALLPVGVDASDAALLDESPVIQRALAEGVSWVADTGCEVTDVATVVPPDDDSKDPGTDSTSTVASSSYNWSGYRLRGLDYDHSYYNQASMIWSVPNAVWEGTGDISATTIWPGIGTGKAGDELFQAGTESQYVPNGLGGGTKTYYAWWEIVPDEPTEVKFSGFPIAAGDEVGSIVTVHANGIVLLDVCDYTVGDCVEKQVNVDAIDILAQQAEWIVERPQLSPGFTELSNFGNEYVSAAHGAQESGSGVSSDPFTLTDSLPMTTLQRMTMTSCDGATTLAVPLNSYPNANGDFVVSWQSPGVHEGC